jgi:hypothetical protein
VINEIGEYKDSMSLLDMLDKLEKFHILKDAREWMGYRKLINKLTHEYPNNEKDVIYGIVLAMEVFTQIEQIIENIKKYIRKIR